MDFSFSKPKRRLLFVFIALLIIWGLTDVRYRASLDPERIHKHRTDLTVYTEAGAAFFDGRNPYEVTSPRGWYYLYPPLFALLMAPLHSLDPQWQGVAWFSISLAMAWGCVVEIRRLLQVVGLLDPRYQTLQRWIPLVSWCGFLAALIPSLDCLQRGQVGLAKTWLVLLGFRLMLEGARGRQWVVGGIVMALPCVLKVIPAFAVGVAVLMLAAGGFSRERQWFGARFKYTLTGLVAGAILFLFILPAGLIGWQSNLDHLQTWSQRIASKADGIEKVKYFGDPYGIRNQSLTNAVFYAGNVLDNILSGGSNVLSVPAHHPETTLMGQAGPVNWVRGIRMLLTVLMVGLALWVARKGDCLAQVAVFGLACMATLMVSPVARGHYFMYLLPAWVFVPLALASQGKEVQARWFALSAPATVIPHYLFLFTLGQLGYLGLTTAFWLLAAGVLMAIGMPARPEQNLAVLAGADSGT